MNFDPLHFLTGSVKRTAIVLLALIFLSSCSSLINSFVIEPTVSNLQKQTDFQLVCEGGPSYLLMIDSLIASDPEEPAMLLIGAKAYSAYLGVLGECGANEHRLEAIADKAKLYGTSLLKDLLPINPGKSVDSLEKELTSLTLGDVERTFWGAAGWTSWIAYQKASPASMVDLAKIEKIMLRLAELDETYGDGAIQLILGNYYGSKPEMLGGKPALARDYFEKGLALSKRRYLPLQAAYAETFCRMTMNRKLHDDLLQEVLDYQLQKAPEFALANQVAKAKARKLLQENFFDE